MSKRQSLSMRDRRGRLIGAWILTGLAMCGVATAGDHDLSDALRAETVLTRIAHPAVSAGWGIDDVRAVLGVPTRVVERPGERWLVYTQHDQQVTFEVSATRVTAVQVTRRTRSVAAFTDVRLALTHLLGLPSSSGRHESRWELNDVDVRVAGWRGEYSMEIRRSSGLPE